MLFLLIVYCNSKRITSARISQVNFAMWGAMWACRMCGESSFLLWFPHEARTLHERRPTRSGRGPWPDASGRPIRGPSQRATPRSISPSHETPHATMHIAMPRNNSPMCYSPPNVRPWAVVERLPW